MENVVRPHLEAGDLLSAQAAIVKQLNLHASPGAALLAEAAYWGCQANDYVAARQWYKRACMLAPEHSTYHYNLATTCRVLGDLSAAEAALNTHLEITPDDAEARWLLVQLRRQLPVDNQADVLRELTAKALPPKQKVHAWFGLGKVLEDNAEYSESFNAYAAGASLRRQYLNYNIANDRAIFARITKTFTASWQASQAAIPDEQQGAGLTFIIGMPRSGTTLVEQLLGAHEQVASGGELNTFSASLMQEIARTSQASDILAAIDHAANSNFSAIGEGYLNGIAAYRGDKPYFTDKLPLNFLYVGLIKQALPGARFIHVVRDPMDTIWSVFKHLFTQAYPFSYDLAEIAHYYLAYRALMTHWEQLVGEQLLTVRYEELVAEPEHQTKRITQFLGIPFNADSVNFYQQGDAVTTGSAAQVREPVHQRNVGQWRHYTNELTPALEILREAGVEC